MVNICQARHCIRHWDKDEKHHSWSRALTVQVHTHTFPEPHRPGGEGRLERQGQWSLTWTTHKPLLTFKPHSVSWRQKLPGAAAASSLVTAPPSSPAPPCPPTAAREPGGHSKQFLLNLWCPLRFPGSQIKPCGPGISFSLGCPTSVVL